MALARGNSVIRTGPLTLKTTAALRAIKHLTKVCGSDWAIESLCIYPISSFLPVSFVYCQSLCHFTYLPWSIISDNHNFFLGIIDLYFFFKVRFKIIKEKPSLDTNLIKCKGLGYTNLYWSTGKNGAEMQCTRPEGHSPKMITHCQDIACKNRGT